MRSLVSQLINNDTTERNTWGCRTGNKHPLTEWCRGSPAEEEVQRGHLVVELWTTRSTQSFIFILLSLRSSAGQRGSFYSSDPNWIMLAEQWTRWNVLFSAQISSVYHHNFTKNMCSFWFSLEYELLLLVLLVLPASRCHWKDEFRLYCSENGGKGSKKIQIPFAFEPKYSLNSNNVFYCLSRGDFVMFAFNYL